MIAASAVALCLGGGLLVGCGGGPGDGYVAVGAAGSGPERSAGGAEGPSGKVTLVPLDGGAEEGGAEGRGGSRSPGAPSSPAEGTGGADAAEGRTGGPAAQPAGSGPGDAPGGGPGGGTSGERTGVSGGSGSGPGSTSGTGAKPAEPSKPPGDGSTPSAPGSPKPGGGGGTTRPPTGKPAPPPTPAALKLSAPQRAPADKRWCEKVTVEFRNTGGSPARSGTITFATHIIGALGVDWATIRSSQALPAPITAGATRSQTYTVCLESWRVPLGMRVETQDVSAVWE